MINSNVNDFGPSSSIINLKQRAKLLRTIRSFFDERGFFEVETPILSHDVVVDRYLDPISIPGDQLGVVETTGKTIWLQTSPEFAMKRLMSSGANAIYQIAKVFRSGESGKLHNPEFTMLEWYRAGDDMQKGMSLLAEFIESTLETDKCNLISYRDAFQKYANIDVFSSDIDEFRVVADQHQIESSFLDNCNDTDLWRNLLLTQVVEPKLGQINPEIVFDWPATQSALAEIRDGAPSVAERFELYFRGVELANGYNELLDADELLARNGTVNRQRVSDGKAELPAESRLIDAMRAGLPACSGVALGVDRLAMIYLNEDSINKTMAFSIRNA